MKSRIFILLCLGALLLAACKPRATPSPEPTLPPTQSVLATPRPAQTQPQPDPPTSPVVEPLPTRPPLDGETLAIIYLANELGIAPVEVTVISSQPVEWPDASLGCPQPDMVYAQIVTPGFLVVLEAGGAQYEVHTGALGQFPVMCP